jgi:hypothetical protein
MEGEELLAQESPGQAHGPLSQRDHCDHRRDVRVAERCLTRLGRPHHSASTQGLKKEGLRSKRDAEQINLGCAPRAFHFVIVGSSPVCGELLILP